MKAVITVIGKDKIGIIAKVTSVLAQQSINILDIRQTIMQEYFTMIMIADLTYAEISFNDLKEKLDLAGDNIGVSVKIQNEDIFNSMHRI